MPAAPFGLTAILIALGAVVATMAGFGFSMSIMPFMLMLYPPEVAVPLVLIVSACGSTVQWYRTRREADYGLVGHLVGGAVLGLPLGGLVLTRVSAPVMKAVIGLFVLMAAAVSFRRQRDTLLPPRRPDRPLTLVTGVAGGILATAVGQSGLAVSLLMAWARLEKRTTRATLFAFFAAANFQAVPTLYLQGVITPSILWFGLTLVPFYFVGMLAGEMGFRRTSGLTYRYLMLGVLATSAVLGVVNGLRSLIGNM